MGRLIDAEIQTDYIVEHDLAFEYAIQHQDRKELERLIAEIPTAYDPDKVVEQLEERIAFLKDCVKYGNKTAEQQSKSYDTMMMYEVKDLVDDLLEIVKAGGADAKTDS